MRNLIPYAFARANRVLPVSEQDGRLQLWVTRETAPSAVMEVRRALSRVLEPVIVLPEQFETRLRATYAQAEGEAAMLVDQAQNAIDLARLVQDIPEVEDLFDEREDAPIVRMLNALLTQAVQDRASDVHVEAYENYSVVRFRVDGALRDVVRPRKGLHAAIVSRLKIMANLDIAEKRLPQDGRILLRLGGKPVDVRVSTLPAGHGERVVLRLLDKEHGQLDPTTLGMAPDTLRVVEDMVRRPNGIFLITGPTGSGKTTTLYALLSRLDRADTNIMTVEDPIEYDLPGIGQTQVNTRIDMTFARALRAILRQDPDVIMIGEIRDLETAQIAVQASLTGHLVLATLHTTDSISAITRLMDMGVEPFLLSSSLLGVLAQRLLRKLCPACKRQDAAGAWRADGCAACEQTGFQGRTGTYELLAVDGVLKEAIHERAGDQMLRRLAEQRGFRSLQQDGERWIASGETSREELLRVTREQ